MIRRIPLQGRFNVFCKASDIKHVAEPIGGSVIIETIFSIPGLGQLGFESVLSRDYPVVLGSLFFFTIIGLLARLLRDLSYIWVDPRVKYFG